MDSVKQSAALCLLRLYKTSPDLVMMGEWTSRVVHLLNDQHMVRTPCETGFNMFYLQTFFIYLMAFSHQACQLSCEHIKENISCS